MKPATIYSSVLDIASDAARDGRRAKMSEALGRIMAIVTPELQTELVWPNAGCAHENAQGGSDCTADAAWEIEYGTPSCAAHLADNVAAAYALLAAARPDVEAAMLTLGVRLLPAVSFAYDPSHQ